MTELDNNVRAYLEEVRLAVFGSTNRDGTPHLTGLWYELRDNTIILNTTTKSKKPKGPGRPPELKVGPFQGGIGVAVWLNEFEMEPGMPLRY